MAPKSTNWGNYTDYHGPNHAPGSPPSIHVRDVRLSVIDGLGVSFDGRRCLDVGCNHGSVASQLAFDFGASQVVGVDIDPALVSKAEGLLALRSSRVRPSTEPSERKVDYFPMSAILDHGSRPPAASHWPRVDFIAADWVVDTPPATAGPFDIILALSVTKWIHLEHLDDGLLAFFRKCSAALASGGYLILEPQPWKSYERAIKPSTAPHFAKNLEKLRYRPETSFTQLLQDQGLHLFKTHDRLARPIHIYRKP